MTATTRETRLFTLRMWREVVGEDRATSEWRGKVQALPEGDAYYFRDWPGLITQLQTVLDAGYTGKSHSEPQIRRQL